MVYCFCLDPSIFSPRFSSSVRACSTMLYIISERWPRAVQARKAFDRLVSATIENEGDGFMLGGQGQVANGLSESHGRFQDGMGVSETSHPEVWTNFESILGDYQIDLGTWMHDSIFDTMSTTQPVDWTK